MFWLGKKELHYVSENLRHSHKTAHEYLFDATKAVYIGLNRIYDDEDALGSGLCHVACKTGKPRIVSFTNVDASYREAYEKSSGESLPDVVAEPPRRPRN